jgi:hypothetical protein
MTGYVSRFMTFLSFPVHLAARKSFYNYLPAISKSTADAIPIESPASAFDLVVLVIASMVFRDYGDATRTWVLP